MVDPFFEAAQRLEVQGLIRLFKVDATRLGGDIYYFHGHANDGAIVWQGDTYSPIAIAINGMERRGDGKVAAPTLKIVNAIDGVVGAISVLCQKLKDFAGAEVHVIDTFKDFLDPVNFLTGENSNASDRHELMIWYIEKKTSETYAEIEFSLVSPEAFQQLKIPSRAMTKICEWAKKDYRGEICGYLDDAMFDANDTSTDDPSKDKCGGRLSSCRCRFKDKPLPFGGFPSVGMIKG